MDIKRISLWEGRNATILSNDTFSVVIEDQGNVVLELSSKNGNGARTSPLSIPYFRGTGRSVLEDENSSWWKMRQTLYQAGGAYFSFPTNEEGKISSVNTSWNIKRYGSENDYGGVWRYSLMNSREIENKYSLSRVDVVLPSQSVLYSAIAIENTGNEDLFANPSFTAMLSYPLIMPKTSIVSNATHFYACPLSTRENGRNRVNVHVLFDDLKKAPTENGLEDISVVPEANGTYDYIIGSGVDKGFPFIAVSNRSSGMCFYLLGNKKEGDGEFSFPSITLGENWFGRFDSPWALYDGATPQVESLSVGFSHGESSQKYFLLHPGEIKTTYLALGYEYLGDKKVPSSWQSLEEKEDGIYLKKVKGESLLSFDTSFKAIRKISKKIFFSHKED